MATPTIVQSAFGRSGSSPVTLTLGSTPTVGNLLLFVFTGFTATITPPSGLFEVESDQAVSQNFEATQSWYRQVQSGDGAGWTFAISSSPIVANFGVFEISGATSIRVANGANTGASSTTLVTGALVASADSTALRLLTIEWDTGAGATVPGGWTLLSPSTWQNVGSSSPNNHAAGIWSIPATTRGTQSLTMSSAMNSYPGVWLDMQVSGTIPLNMNVGQVTRQALFPDDKQPNLNVGQIARQALLPFPENPSLAVGQIARLALVTTSIAPSSRPNFVVVT